jgi:spoIIIJ-associated protein
MDERTTLEVIAPTVEEAISRGLAQLGLPADAVSVEVLDSGGKGFFGFGARQVRVRLTVNVPPETPVPAPAPEPEPDSPPAAESPAETESDPLLARTQEVIETMLRLMSLDAEVSVRYEAPDKEGRKPVRVEIHGDDLSILIGRRAETLNAFQRIAALILSKEEERWVQLIIDVEGYRSRRERQLRRMARRVAEQAVKTGRRQTLEPMPANERRIIHIELRENPDVETQSIGEEPRRKVTIIPK